jgi:hypothetical protein
MSSLTSSMAAMMVLGRGGVGGGQKTRARNFRIQIGAQHSPRAKGRLCRVRGRLVRPSRLRDGARGDSRISGSGNRVDCRL